MSMPSPLLRDCQLGEVGRWRGHGQQTRCFTHVICHKVPRFYLLDNLLDVSLTRAIMLACLFFILVEVLKSAFEKVTCTNVPHFLGEFLFPHFERTKFA